MKQLTRNSHRESLKVVVMDRQPDCVAIWLFDHQDQGKYLLSFFFVNLYRKDWMNVENFIQMSSNTKFTVWYLNCMAFTAIFFLFIFMNHYICRNKRDPGE